MAGNSKSLKFVPNIGVAGISKSLKYWCGSCHTCHPSSDGPVWPHTVICEQHFTKRGFSKTWKIVKKISILVYSFKTIAWHSTKWCIFIYTLRLKDIRPVSTQTFGGFWQISLDPLQIKKPYVPHFKGLNK